MSGVTKAIRAPKDPESSRKYCKMEEVRNGVEK
jgi:hypothetical protein